MAPRILRITRDAELLTAQVFEELFDRHFGGAFAVTRAPLEGWCAEVLGPPAAPLAADEAARRFAAATAEVDVICPSWECIPLAPLLLALRNRARARARLLLISHAAGAYAMEWTLLRPLLVAGDVIVTPSESARRTVEFLCPEIAPFLRVISHPMAPLPRIAAEPPAARPRIVSLGRVHAQKLIHRQIEAMAVLRARGRTPLPLMEIGGPLDDGGIAGPHPYTRALAERVRRLGLEDDVRFVGAVRGDARKGAFLSTARLVINLSVTVEESFPKTPVEALGVGVPVLGTSWNGIRDTVGSCGVLIPVSVVGAGVGTVDVTAEAVADGIERLLDAPPSAESCMAHVAQFRPEVSLGKYRAALEGAAAAAASADAGSYPEWPNESVAAAPAAGLLSAAAPLSQFSYRELFDLYARGCSAMRAGWARGAAPVPDNWDRIRALLQAATQAPLERFFGGLPQQGPASAAAAERAGGDLVDRLAGAAMAPGTVSGRLACAAEVMLAGRLAQGRAALARIERDPAVRPASVAALRVELLCLEGRHAEAFALCEATLAEWPAVESEAHRLRQAARVARKWGRPAAALAVLDAWLARHPDAQESGPVWLDRCVNAYQAGPGHVDAAAAALDRARALLGEMPAVVKAGAALAARRTLAAVA